MPQINQQTKFSVILSMGIFLVFSMQAHGQSSYKDFVYNNPSVKWAAEYESLVNLTPKTNTISLKKWYLNKLKTNHVKTYELTNDGKIKTNGSLYLPSLQKQEWLKDYYVLAADNPARWEFRNRKNQHNYEVLPSFISESCCGCDESDAFRVKQLIIYEEAQLIVRNILLSPLCARKTNSTTAAWYPLENFGFNSSSFFSANAKFLTEREVTYDINPFDSIMNFQLLTEGEPGLVAHLFKDIKKGKLTAYDVASGNKIPYNQLLTWNMPIDTVEMYDVNTMEPGGYKVVQQQLNISDLTQMKILQKWYFDTGNEKLYSRVESVTLFKKISDPAGLYRGLQPVFIIKFNNKAIARTHS
jgi:hypothetical protein